jgi:hypothetical protein
MRFPNIFSSVWRKLLGAINFIYKYVAPIYIPLVAIIKEVQKTDLEDDSARKAVFQKITDFIQSKGLEKFPDSILNAIIELVYLIIKWKLA